MGIDIGDWGLKMGLDIGNGIGNWRLGFEIWIDRWDWGLELGIGIGDWRLGLGILSSDASRHFLSMLIRLFQSFQSDFFSILSPNFFKTNFQVFLV